MPCVPSGGLFVAGLVIACYRFRMACRWLRFGFACFLYCLVRPVETFGLTEIREVARKFSQLCRSLDTTRVDAKGTPQWVLRYTCWRHHPQAHLTPGPEKVPPGLCAAAHGQQPRVLGIGEGSICPSGVRPEVPKGM